jgi:thiol:disulfide interchange protein
MMSPCFRVACLLFAVSVAAAAGAQSSKELDLDGTGQHQRVNFLGPDNQSVVAGKVSPVQLRFSIADDFHINSHTPKSDFLLPTRLLAIDEPGMNTRAVDFPPGEEYAFSFDPKTKLDVYSGEFTLLAHVTAERGEHTFHAVLRYQACDHAACYPPKELPVEVKVQAR